MRFTYSRLRGKNVESEILRMIIDVAIEMFIRHDDNNIATILLLSNLLVFLALTIKNLLKAPKSTTLNLKTRTPDHPYTLMPKNLNHKLRI